MIDLEGLPLPENAPAPGSCVRVEEPEAGLVRFVLDPPHRDNTVLDLPLLRDLDLALEKVEQDARVRGLVITGREPLHFAFGADIDSIESVNDPKTVEHVVRVAHGLFRRIAKLPARTVAAAGGPVPGGAYELCLACDWILLADDPKTRVGLPETQLGIIPAWGGIHRLPKRAGILFAMGAILKGRLVRPRQALKAGMVDRLTPPEYLERIAADLALGRDVPRPRRDRLRRVLIDKNPVARAFIASRARTQVLTETGGKYPAVLEAIELISSAQRTDMEEAENKEAAVAAKLATGPVCKSLISIFRASEAAKKLGVQADGRKPAPFERAGVIGAGVMGGPIASVLAERGVYTRLADLSREALDAAVADHRSHVKRKVDRRQLERHEGDRAVDNLDATVGTVGFGRVQIVVEAVAERLEVKRAVLSGVAGEVPEDAILATNTSSLSVDAIAEPLPGPERVVGLHFFNPVRRMPLVEIVRGSRTADDVVTRVAALALRMGKTPVVVKDVAGFLVNRILGPYLDEALRLFDGGVDPERLDRALEDFGMPMGPLRLLDEVGFDIASHAATSLFEAYGPRMRPCPALDAMMDAGRLGRKSSSGFYAYAGKLAKKKTPKLNADLAKYKRSDKLAHLADEDLVDRCILAMVNEAARCLADDVVASATELDLATVFGMGFAPFRGGLLRHADSVGGRVLVDRMRTIASSADVSAREGGAERFEPCGLILELAATGGRFHGKRPELALTS